MKKLIAFDLDGTLTESKSAITPEMAELLHRLSLQAKVAVISGGSFDRFKKQLLISLKPSSNIILLPTDGSERFEWDAIAKEWKMTDREVFPAKLKKEVIKAIEEIISSGLYDIPSNPAGKLIEDRDTEITLSALGQEADLEKKKTWDPDQKKRQKIKAVLDPLLPEVNIVVAGTTSIDFLPKGFDKAFGLKLLLKKINVDQKDILFIGDSVFPGGNDYSPYQAGMETIKVKDPAETAKVIENILKEGSPEIKSSKTSPAAKSISLPLNPLAYFCAEYALDDDATMYAGGLGVLAADYLLEMAEKNFPAIAIGLKYGEGETKDLSLLSHNNEPLIIEIPVGKEMIKAQVWHRILAEKTHMLLLDTNFSGNSDENKKITETLYDPHFYMRIQQQMVLGIGGVRLIKKLGITPKIYHLNEGHTAFAGIAVMAEIPGDVGKIVGTKHTILSAAGLQISRADFTDLVGPYAGQVGADIGKLYETGKFELNHDIFSTTKCVMTLAVRKNGVSEIHTLFEKKVHPHSELITVTNGVYKRRWQSPLLLGKLKTISDEELLAVRRNLRSNLFSYIEHVSGKKFNPNIATLVWARRFAGYKRPSLLFSDEQKLIDIISSAEFPLQIVISGKAAPGDQEGEAIVRRIISFAEKPEVKDRIVYLPHYSISVAEHLTQGADIWLNTPERGKEACGTSGMKASMNGALQCTISDGWVDEEKWGGRGWILPEDTTENKTAEILYDLLEHEILPSFYAHESLKGDWIARMRSTIELVESRYTATRMMNDYLAKLYLLKTEDFS